MLGVDRPVSRKLTCRLDTSAASAPLRDDPERRWAAGKLIRSFDRRYVTDLAKVHAQITVPVQLV